MYVLTRKKELWNVEEELWGTYKFSHNLILHRKKFAAPAYTKGKEESYFVNGYPYILKDGLMIREIFKYSKRVLSSENEPAVLYPNGTKEWYCDGMLHRLNFPAIEYTNGDVEYWNWGKRHRQGGPAVVIGKNQYWFENGNFIKYDITV